MSGNTLQPLPGQLTPQPKLTSVFGRPKLNELGEEALSSESDSTLDGEGTLAAENRAPAYDKRISHQIHPGVVSMQRELHEKVAGSGGTNEQKGMSGFAQLFGRPQPPPPEGTPRAQAALSEIVDPDPTHPMMQHSSRVRSDLEKEGLPTKADGVKVYAVGEASVNSTPFTFEAEHGKGVVRSVAGPAGLGQGADVELLDRAESLAPKPSEADLKARAERQGKIYRGQADLETVGKMGVDAMEHNIYQMASEVRKVRERAPDDGKTKILTASFGSSPARAAQEVAKYAHGSGRGSTLEKQINKAQTDAGLPAVDFGIAAHKNFAITAHGAGAVAKEAAKPENKARIEKAQAVLAEEVRLANEKGIVVMSASGNSNIGSNAPKALTSDPIAQVPGVIMVGAASLGKNATDVSDDQTANFSSPAHVTARGGVGMPVMGTAQKNADGKSLPMDTDGTSFSTPYLAGVTALMVKANPKITPAEIESILKDPSVARDDVSTNRDGAGIVDEVAAVRRAAELGRI